MHIQKCAFDPIIYKVFTMTSLGYWIHKNFEAPEAYVNITLAKRAGGDNSCIRKLCYNSRNP